MLIEPSGDTTSKVTPPEHPDPSNCTLLVPPPTQPIIVTSFRSTIAVAPLRHEIVSFAGCATGLATKAPLAKRSTKIWY